MIRRRRRLAISIVLAAVVGNLYLDYLLVLRNPAEVEALIRRTLEAVAPEYDPSIGRLEIAFRERQAVITGLEFHERGDPSRTLVEIERVEATVQLVPPAVTRVVLYRPRATLRVDEQGRLNVATGTPSSQPGKPPLYADLDLRIEEGRFRFQNDYQGQGSDMLLDDLTADFTVTPELAISGRGQARLGTLFALEDPLAAGGHSAPGLPTDRRYHDLFPQLDLAVQRGANAPLNLQVGLKNGSLTPQLRSLIPELFQRTIWAELNPSGGVVDVQLRAHVSDGARVNASIRPRGVTVRPRGFSIPITDVGGPFEVTVAIPPEGPPEVLQVGWENVQGHVSGGEVVSRGSAWPGADDEHLTLFLFIDAAGIDLTPELVAAMPEDIRGVYRRFDPQGTVGRAKVMIFKGPFQEEPQISATVADLEGSISASYEDYPVRLYDVDGSFTLKEGANVEVRARGRLDLGGRAEVEAMVMHGDLIHVDVRGQGVPLGTRILDVLSPGVRRYVAPFHPEGGKTDFQVVVDKPGADALAIPRVTLDLDGVTVAHDLFPFRVATKGRVQVVPVFPAGAGPDDEVEPERIEVQLDLGISRAGAVDRARVRGPLSIPLGAQELSGDLRVNAGRVELGQELLDALPPALQDVARQLRPSGALVDASARVRALDRMEIETRGDGLLLAPGPPGEPGRARQFLVQVERARVSRDGRRIGVQEVVGRAPGGGRLLAQGEVRTGAPGEEPTLALDVDVQDALLDARLLELLPAGEARETLARLEPRGRADARVELRSGPGLPPQHTIALTLRDTELRVHALAPALAGLEREPLRDLRGQLRVELPRGVDLLGLRGRLAGAEVEVGGRVGIAPEAPSPLPGAALGGPGGAVLGLIPQRLAPPLDLTVQVVDYQVDARTAQLGGPPARAALERFPATGPLDLAAWVSRPAYAREPDLRLRVSPRGMRVVPALLPVPCEGVTGQIELIGGEPVLIDVAGSIGEGRFQLHRDRRREGRLPDGGAGGMALSLQVDGLARPREHRAFEAELPARFRGVLDELEPAGPLDLRAQIYLPEAPEEAIVWVAEVRPRDLALSAGVRLEEMNGVLRLNGRVRELERGSLEGELELERMSWMKQAFSRLRGRLRVRDGVLSLGVRGVPFVGNVYGGQLTGLIEYTFQSGAYEGWLRVADAKVGRAVEELGRLREGKGGSSSGPVKGDLTAWMHFLGGGEGLDGRPRRFQGRGEVRATDTNLVEVPGLDVFRGLADALRGESTAPLAFETMSVEYHTDGRRLFLDKVRLDSPALALTGAGGWVRFSDDPDKNGDIHLDLVPLDTGSDVITLFLRENILPLTGYLVRGKVWDVTVVTGIPFFPVLERPFTEHETEDEGD